MGTRLENKFSELKKAGRKSLIIYLTCGLPEAEDTVEDLILLAKQGAPAEEMRQVLAARIICMPTAEMEAALQALHDRIPKWFTLNMERVQ